MACNFWRCSHYLEWLLDRQDVLRHRAPDLKDLGCEEEYQKVMIFFAGVIQAFGRGIEVRQQVIATATVYFRRFYSRTSLKSIDPWLMAPACLFLASKVEEFGVLSQNTLMSACRKVVNNQYSKYFKEYGFPYSIQDVFECEFILMEAMDCSLIVFHPYRPLIQFCEDMRPQLLGLTDALLERAWHIVNDSMRIDLCLHYPPYLIALGCLQLAFISLEKNPPNEGGPNGAASYSAKHGSISSPNNQPAVSPLVIAENWFSDLMINMEKVLEVSRQMLSLYDLWQRFDPDTDIPPILQKKRPVIQNQQSQSQSQQPQQSQQMQHQHSSQAGLNQIPSNVSHSPNCSSGIEQQLRQIISGGSTHTTRMGQPLQHGHTAM